MALTLDIDALAAAADWDQLAPEARRLLPTLQSNRFPGAVFPARAPDGGMLFYAAATSPAEWRKLQPLLTAFAGPTFTDFEGAPTRLDPSNGVERLLLAACVTDAARLRPGRFPQPELISLRALVRMAALLEGAPDLAMARPEPTARLLAALQDALNGGDQAEAWRIHTLLREESRLEAINLVQVEIQILAASGDWGAIRWHDRFETLVLAGPSPATAEHLLEAVYWTAAYDTSEDRERARDEILVDPATEFARLLLTVAPRPAKPVVERLRNLLLSPARDPVPPTINDLVKAETPPQPTAQARAALLAVASLSAEGDPEADAALLDAVGALSPAEREDLLRRPANRAIWQEVLERTGKHAPPTDWLGWVEALGREDFPASEIAASGATNWRLLDQDIDATVPRNLAARIEAIPDGLAEDRFGEATPYLVQWARSDPRWPRQNFCSVYVSILVRMALSARRGETALRSAAGLLEGALQCGLSQVEYRDALDAAETISTEGLSRTSAYDALEIVEITRSVTPADPERLQAFSLNVISVLAALWNRLGDGQRLTLAALAAEVGMEFGPSEPSAAQTALSSPALEGKILGIYTLTEQAARQAETMLRGAIPGLTVDLNHDHGGSAALNAMVSRADLVVVVWASAKHAATDFIKARRGNRPLVYAMGRGATSIVRAVDDWLAADARRVPT
jgi:hypothetical protein